MFFPWVGLFEQINLADVFVHYDDVQLPQGRTFISRVQLKSPEGAHWLTMPLKRHGSLRNINETLPSDDQSWRQSHLMTLRHLYAKAPHLRDMIGLVEDVYANEFANIALLNAYATEKIAAYFDLQCEFRTSSEMQIPGKSSDRLLDLVKSLNGDTYITGHGARNYLDHELFERNGVRVEYMRYNQSPYGQLHGAFSPFVSTLDLIANDGKNGRRVITSLSEYWRQFLG